MPVAAYSRPFSEYFERYQTLVMERDADGILLLRAHTGGGPLRWGALPHEEWPRAFADIAMDRENRVVILTGTGDEFSGPRPSPATRNARPVAESPLRLSTKRKRNICSYRMIVLQAL